MSFKKRATKSIALALVGVTIVTPMLKTASAMGNVSNDKEVQELLLSNNLTEEQLLIEKSKRENFDENTPMNQLFSINQVNLIKYEFQKRNGTENKFKIVENKDGYITEINGAKGIIKLKSDIDGEITINYFDELDKLAAESLIKAPNRPGAWKTQGPDNANMRVVKGSTREEITANNPIYSNLSKTYTKPLNQWYTGYTKGYYDAVGKARKSFGTAINTISGIHISAYKATMAALVAQGKLSMTPKGLKKALVAGGVVGIAETAVGVTYGVAYLANIGEILVNYNKL